jgi:hypothetical protein
MIKVGEKLITYQASKEEAFTDAYTELLGYIYIRVISHWTWTALAFCTYIGRTRVHGN